MKTAKKYRKDIQIVIFIHKLDGDMFHDDDAMQDTITTIQSHIRSFTITQSLIITNTQPLITINIQFLTITQPLITINIQFLTITHSLITTNIKSYIRSALDDSQVLYTFPTRFFLIYF